MNPYTQKLLNAITDYESQCGISDPASVLESLWYDYSCRNPVDDGQVREAEAHIAPIFRELSVESSDHLSDLIVNLLTAYQRAAYLEGLCTGVHLLQALT